MSVLGWFTDTNRNTKIKVLPPRVFKSKISRYAVQLIDIRTPQEYNLGHIENAKNINFFSRNFKPEFDQMDRVKPLYLYCRSGSRSRKAAHVLARMGFEEIYDLEGGFLRWDNK
jgi:rhodanese-related sulfurtransferase